jgi:protein SCO1/2
MNRALYLLLLAPLLLVSCGGDANAKPAGTDLGGRPSPEFRLTDQDGREVTLSDLRGRPFALAFLYTQCPDICPLTAQKLGQATQTLGKDAEKVGVVAISVDPTGDTPELARQFMATHGLSGAGRHYLLGDEAMLAPLWLAYGVGVIPVRPGGQSPPAGVLPQTGRLGHSDVIYLIDRDGRQRTLLHADASVDEISRGLRALLR